VTDAAPDPVEFSRDDKFVILACAISMLIVQMDWFALNLAIPAIAEHFNVPSTDLQWVVSGYMLSIGALMVTAGRLADIFGRRLVIVIGLAIFGVVSFICGTAPGELYLIVARVVHGVGAALIFPVSIAVVSSTFSGARQARAIGVVLGVSALGQALGPFVGGAFSEYLSWRGVFFINIPFCIAAIYLMLRYVKESRDEKADRHVDIPGMLTITGGLVCISLAFDRGEAWGWTSAATLGTFVAGVVLLVLFVIIEGRVKSPLVSLALFRNRAFDAVVIAGSLSNVVFCLVAVFSALYLQQARGMSPFNCGLVFLALSAGAGGASFYSGRLAEKFPCGSPDGDRHADQRGRHRGLDQRHVAMALHAAVPRDRRRPRAQLGVDAGGDAGGRAARIRRRRLRRHAHRARDAGRGQRGHRGRGARNPGGIAASRGVRCLGDQHRPARGSGARVRRRGGAASVRAAASPGDRARYFFPLNGTTFWRCSPSPLMPTVITSPAFRN
jgi:MFS family permease